MSSPSMDWVPFLKKVGFFSAFNEDELSLIARRMSVFSMSKGAVLFREGEQGEALYLIHSGRIRLSQGRNGQERTVAFAGRGDTIGEMSLIAGQPTLYTATVDATADLIVLYRKDFEPILNEVPTAALHLSRVLAKRLVESTRQEPTSAVPSKIYPIISHQSLPNRVVFTVNLALSLAEQTRRRVLLLDILDQDSGVFTAALGMRPVRVGENSLRQEDLQSANIMQRLVVYHPSGLELLTLPLALMDGKFFSALYPFLALLRDKYDITLLSLPPKITPAVRVILEESDSPLYVEKDTVHPDDPKTLADIASIIPADKITRVQLTESAPTLGGPVVNFRLPWRQTMSRELMDSGKIFLPGDASSTQRMVDRLARHLGGIRIGFVMGSGASYGYSMIGMLKVLERNGIFPDVISGTSIGALIGSFYAAGKTPSELEEIALSITKKKLFALSDITLPWQGLILGREVLRFLKTVLGEKTFDELDIPFACVATDIMSGEEVVLKDGKVAEAVRGSLSLPFFFQPFFLNGRYLVDGGLTNPVPTSVAAALGANILISVNLTTKPSAKKLAGFRNRRRYSSAYMKGPNILEVMMKTIYTMQFEIAQARSEMSHVVIAPDMSSFAWSEFHRAPDIIRIGETVMEDALPKIKTLLPLYADHCRVPLKKAANNGY